MLSVEDPRGEETREGAKEGGGGKEKRRRRQRRGREEGKE